MVPISLLSYICFYCSQQIIEEKENRRAEIYAINAVMRAYHEAQFEAFMRDQATQATQATQAGQGQATARGTQRSSSTSPQTRVRSRAACASISDEESGESMEDFDGE